MSKLLHQRLHLVGWGTCAGKRLGSPGRMQFEPPHASCPPGMAGQCGKTFLLKHGDESQ